MSGLQDYDQAIKKASRDPISGRQKLLELASLKARKNQECYNSKGITKLVDFSNKTTDSVWNSYEFMEAKEKLTRVMIIHQLLTFSLKALFLFVIMLISYLSFVSDDLAVMKAVIVTITTVVSFVTVLSIKLCYLQHTVKV